MRKISLFAAAIFLIGGFFIPAASATAIEPPPR